MNRCSPAKKRNTVAQIWNIFNQLASCVIRVDENICPFNKTNVRLYLCFRTKHTCSFNKLTRTFLSWAAIDLCHAAAKLIREHRLRTPSLELTCINRTHKWRTRDYSFVFVRIILTSLTLKQEFFWILFLITRPVRMVSIKVKVAIYECGL